MALKLEVQMQGTLYKCFDCLNVYNPETDVIHVVAAITQIAPNEQGLPVYSTGSVMMCPNCFQKNTKANKFMLTSKLLQKPPIIDKSGSLNKGEN